MLSGGVAGVAVAEILEMLWQAKIKIILTTKTTSENNLLWIDTSPARIQLGNVIKLLYQSQRFLAKLDPKRAHLHSMLDESRDIQPKVFLR